MDIDKGLLKKIAMQMESAWHDRVEVMSGRMREIQIGFAYAEAVNADAPKHDVCLILLDIYYFYTLLMQYHMERQYEYNCRAA
ncbi:MAG: hypothetical protein H6Q69_1680 [Firmicutes bacterium]|nr:hypothetical protein [Bacillota bacterium]